MKIMIPLVSIVFEEAAFVKLGEKTLLLQNRRPVPLERLQSAEVRRQSPANDEFCLCVCFFFFEVSRLAKHLARKRGRECE